ncbi:hypothetical protein Hdeb2414_s0015g00443541 [Helianthus debilis subsp. tardiflorus]
MQCLWGFNDRVLDILGSFIRNGHGLSTGCRHTPDSCVCIKGLVAGTTRNWLEAPEL